MKLAIIGTGMIVEDLLQILHKVTLEKVAIWGRNQQKAQEITERYKLDLVFPSYEATLESDFDTVYIALSNHIHFQFAKLALEAGKNVILEKPSTPTLAEFQILRNLAKQKNVFLIEAVTVHYLPAYLELAEQVLNLGDIKIVSLNYSQYSSRYDRFKAGETPPVFDPTKAGGALMDLNVYNLHFSVGLFGKPQSYQYFPNIERGIDTSGILVLNYSHFQAVCIGAKDCGSPVQLAIQGDKGNIIAKMPANIISQFNLSNNKGQTMTFGFEETHRMLPEFQRFVEIIDKKQSYIVEKMLNISEIVCEIIENARKQAGILFENE